MKAIIDLLPSHSHDTQILLSREEAKQLGAGGEISGKLIFLSMIPQRIDCILAIRGDTESITNDNGAGIGYTEEEKLFCVFLTRLRVDEILLEGKKIHEKWLYKENSNISIEFENLKEHEQFLERFHKEETKCVLSEQTENIPQKHQIKGSKLKTASEYGVRKKSA